MESNQLLREARAGSRVALDALFATCRPTLHTHIHRHLDRHDEAENLLQETFVQAQQSLGRYRGDGPFCAWLLGISNRLLLRHHARLRPREKRFISLSSLTEDDLLPVQQDGGSQPPYDSVDDAEYVERLLAVMQICCTENECTVIRLVYAGEEYETIGLLLVMSAAQARTHFLRGRLKLLSYLVQNAPQMLGGHTAIQVAWEKACRSTDPSDQPTESEKRAFAHPEGHAKAFYKAVMKLARHLPLPILLLTPFIRSRQ